MVRPLADSYPMTFPTVIARVRRAALVRAIQSRGNRRLALWTTGTSPVARQRYAGIAHRGQMP